jgi:hexosaminidase
MYRRLDPVSVELETLGLHHLSSEDAGLRVLLGSENIGELGTFAEAFEPVSFGERYHQQHTSQLTPLTQFVDAVRPDPPIRHTLDLAAQAFLAEPTSTSASVNEARQTLSEFFAREAAVAPQVLQAMNGAPRLQPMQMRAEQLEELAKIGQGAVRYLSGEAQAPTGWKSRSLAKIEAAKKPSEMVRFQFLPTLIQLVEANK